MQAVLRLDKHTNILLCFYLTCILPHLEYSCQLWDLNVVTGIQSLESAQIFVGKVCLKGWDMDNVGLAL